MTGPSRKSAEEINRAIDSQVREEKDIKLCALASWSGAFEVTLLVEMMERNSPLGMVEEQGRLASDALLLIERWCGVILTDARIPLEDALDLYRVGDIEAAVIEARKALTAAEDILGREARLG